MPDWTHVGWCCGSTVLLFTMVTNRGIHQPVFYICFFLLCIFVHNWNPEAVGFASGALWTAVFPLRSFLQHMSMLHIISCYVPWYPYSAQTTERDTRVPSSSIWKRPLSTSPPSCVRSPGNLERSAQREQPFCALLYLRSSASCCDAIWTEKKLACA